MMKIRNDRDKWVFVFVISFGSVLASVFVTWVLSPDGFGFAALTTSIAVPLMVAPVASLLSARMMLKIHQLNKELEYLARHDQMTGLLNRAAFFDRFAQADAPAAGSIIMADIDKFKDINDTYGHQAGDQVIRKVSDILKAQIEPEGVAARFGGEEFVGYCQGELIEHAERRAEAIRAAVESQSIMVNGQALSCTLSLGVSIFDGSRPLDEVLHAADEALYDAKKSGRNRVFRRKAR